MPRGERTPLGTKPPHPQSPGIRAHSDPQTKLSQDKEGPTLITYKWSNMVKIQNLGLSVPGFEPQSCPTDPELDVPATSLKTLTVCIYVIRIVPGKI